MIIRKVNKLARTRGAVSDRTERGESKKRNYNKGQQRSKNIGGDLTKEPPQLLVDRKKRMATSKEKNGSQPCLKETKTEKKKGRREVEDFKHKD